MNTTWVAIGVAILVASIIAFYVLDLLDDRAAKRRRRRRIDQPPRRRPEPVAVAVQPVATAVVPPPVANAITVERYRRRVDRLEQLVGVLTQQLALRPSHDRIAIFLDVHGDATIETIAQALRLEPVVVERRLRADLDGQVDNYGDEWGLTVRSKDLDETWLLDSMPALEGTVGAR